MSQTNFGLMLPSPPRHAGDDRPLRLFTVNIPWIASLGTKGRNKRKGAYLLSEADSRRVRKAAVPTVSQLADEASPDMVCN